jgi:hypothetical protein
MHSKQIKRIATHAKSAFDFQMTCKVPSMTTPTLSPLWVLLKSLPPRLRLDIKGVRLNPSLGYNNGQQWHNAEQLYNWLGGDNKRGGWESSPADSYLDRRFTKKLTINDLLDCSASFPSSEVFSRYGISLSKPEIPSVE